MLSDNGGRVGTPYRPGVSVPPGSKTRANRHQDSPGTREVCTPPTPIKSVAVTPNPKTPGPFGCVCPRGSEATDAALVSPREGKKRARRAAEVGVSS